jgi:riboflavin synthase
MFTGIIQTLGEITASEVRSGDIRLTITTEGMSGEIIELGDSVACNGICLTVIEMNGAGHVKNLVFDVSKESINKSLIADWKQGQKVNMELAMLPTTRFGGHIVSGHVDGLGELIKSEQDARSWRLWFKAQPGLEKYIATKGSITIDGVSLTVNGVEGAEFHVNIVPHTMQVTTLGDRKVGDKVHLEIDVVARYLERLLNHGEVGNADISLEKLAENGYLK